MYCQLCHNKTKNYYSICTKCFKRCDKHHKFSVYDAYRIVDTDKWLNLLPTNDDEMVAYKHAIAVALIYICFQQPLFELTENDIMNWTGVWSTSFFNKVISKFTKSNIIVPLGNNMYFNTTPYNYGTKHYRYEVINNH